MQHGFVRTGMCCDFHSLGSIFFFFAARCHTSHGYDENIAGQKVLAVEADEHLGALQKYCEQRGGSQGEVLYLQKLGRKLIHSAVT